MIPPRGRVPSALLPLTYLLTAAVAFVLAALAVLWLPDALAGHYYHPGILALTHIVTLGWITLTIMGASYQIIPIVLERPLWSGRLAWWQFGLFVAGVVGLVGHFITMEWAGLVGSAGLIVLGTGGHLVNAALTVRGLHRWTFTARLIVMALLGFGLTALFGAALGLEHVRQTLPGAFFAKLHAHVHLALLGWVLPMVIGIAARVYPMFLLAPEPQGAGGAVQLWGIGLGVPATVLGLLFESPLAAVGGVAVATAVTAHLVWILRMVRTRRRPALDWGVRFALTGTAFLVPATALGLALGLGLVGGPRWAMAYAVLAFGAWASLTIVGMMFKIVPFLVWVHAYSPLVGLRAVPTLAQMSSPRAEQLTFTLLATGMGALTVAVGAGEVTWIRAAGIVVALGALAFAGTLARVVLPLWPGRRACHP